MKIDQKSSMVLSQMMDKLGAADMSFFVDKLEALPPARPDGAEVAVNLALFCFPLQILLAGIFWGVEVEFHPEHWVRNV